MKFFKKSMKYVMAAAAVVALGGLLGGCGSNMMGNEKKAEPLKVVATVFPVADVAKQVGGDKVDVTMLVPPGAEPHDWEPSANDLKMIGTAKVFLYSGAGLEPTDKILTKDVLKDAKPYELSKGLDLLKAADEDEDDHDHDADKKDGDKKGEEDKHEHEHGEYDPHVWLDPMNVSAEVDTVVKAFSEADPANKEYYEKNGAAYKEKLAKLDNDFMKFAATQTNKDLVVSHQAFGYFAKRYGFTQVAIMGVSPDAEPTPERMSAIVSFVKEHMVKAIFGEDLVNPKLANAIAEESGAKVYVLNPAEGLTEEQTKEGYTYLRIMEMNLETLKKALNN